MSAYWQLASDLLGGAAKVRQGGEKYLPKFADEERLDYEVRQRWAKFTNIFGDILTNLAAKPFRKELGLKDGSASSKLTALAEDIDGEGNNLHVFAGSLFIDGLAKGLSWIFVDHTRAVRRPGGRPATIAEERAAGARPYWYRVEPENVLEVEVATVKGRQEIVRARLLECAVERDGFDEKEVERVRVLERPRLSGGGYGPATWTLFEAQQTQANSSKVWVEIDSGEMSIGIIPLVPFFAGRRCGPMRVDPPLRDVAELQIEHYQAESSLKHTTMLACYPMLTARGLEKPTNGSKIRVGPNTVLFAPSQGENSLPEWKFIEPEGKSLQFMADYIKAIEQQMRELGRQPLTATTGNLTVVTTAFAASKANSVIAAWSLNLKDALELALAYTARWLNEPEEAEVEIDSDFDVPLIDEKGPDQLLTMRKSGDLSRRGLWAEFKRRGIFAPEFDPDAEDQRLIDEMSDPASDDEIAAALHPSLKVVK